STAVRTESLLPRTAISDVVARSGCLYTVSGRSERRWPAWRAEPPPPAGAAAATCCVMPQDHPLTMISSSCPVATDSPLMSPARAERTERNMSAPEEVPTAEGIVEGIGRDPGRTRFARAASACCGGGDVPAELDRSAERALLVHRLVVELDVDV